MLVVFAVVAETIISYYRTRRVIRDEYFSKLELISSSYDKQIDLHFSGLKENMEYILTNPDFYNWYKTLDTTSNENEAKAFRETLKSNIFSPYTRINRVENIFIVNKGNEIIYQHDDLDVSHTDFHNMDNQLIDLHMHKFYVNPPLRENNKFYTYFSLPIKNKNNTLEGIILGKIPTGYVLNQLETDSVYQQSFHFTPFKNYNKETYVLDQAVFNKAELSDHYDFLKDTKKEYPLKLKTALIKKKNKEHDLVAWKYSKLLGVGLLYKYDEKQVMNVIQTHNTYTILIGIGIILIAFILSIFFARILTYPMLKLKKVLSLVSNGVLPKELNTPLKDEIGDMIKIVNKIVRSQKKTAAFALKIGEGKFNVDFKPISDKDTLGQALVNMKESLQKADQKDMLRNWVVTGVAEIGEILRSYSQLDVLGDEVLKYLCSRIGAVQGAFYVIDEKSEDKPIHLISSYAYNKKKHLKVQFGLHEGLVGQAATEKSYILRTEVPEDYMHISSGLIGEQKPRCVFIIPLITNEKIYGILEFASFEVFSEGHIKFMEDVSEIIARTIFNIKVNDNTRRLLEQSQRMSSELKEQQEELKDNAVHMEETQQELKKTNIELQKQISEVNNAQNRIRALLENASEVITIYDEDGTVTYVSPSVQNILGHNEKDLVGLKDIKYIDENDQPGYLEMFSDLLENPEKTLRIEYRYYSKTGEKIWLEATGKNLLDDPAINGIVLNSQDITERKRAEEEERKRGQMQSLSENSPDLILRMDTAGKIYYINPTISRLTPYKPKNIINKNIDDTLINKSIIDDWKSIVAQVSETNKKMNAETDFKTEDIELIMNVNAIPEFNDEKELETVLIVCHDITEQKAIENEIKNTNSKLNDSINYAELIQEAILPNNDYIRKTFNDSFIYFKPRDIVSGDFPWFARYGDDVYIAAVDCTGHGVPGAMISMVGYFLLNNIVDGKEKMSSGEVLNKLDKSVTDTFRQNSADSKLKDGMDLAICRVNLKTLELEYSGANRPLYYLKDGDLLSEIKGDKFPIGGGKAYSNKTDFTTHTLKMSKGDAIYFFSDGYPDQFGGDTNDKFGAKRIKELIIDNRDKSLDQMYSEFDSQFNKWKGDKVQTDDVLLIGIRF